MLPGDLNHNRIEETLGLSLFIDDLVNYLTYILKPNFIRRVGLMGFESHFNFLIKLALIPDNGLQVIQKISKKHPLRQLKLRFLILQVLCLLEQTI